MAMISLQHKTISSNPSKITSNEWSHLNYLEIEFQRFKTRSLFTMAATVVESNRFRSADLEALLWQHCSSFYLAALNDAIAFAFLFAFSVCGVTLRARKKYGGHC